MKNKSNKPYYILIYSPRSLCIQAARLSEDIYTHYVNNRISDIFKVKDGDVFEIDCTTKHENAESIKWIEVPKLYFVNKLHSPQES